MREVLPKEWSINWKRTWNVKFRRDEIRIQGLGFRDKSLWRYVAFRDPGLLAVCRNHESAGLRSKMRKAVFCFQDPDPCLNKG